MYIESLEWIDKDIREAEIVVSDGLYRILCFSQPFDYEVKKKTLWTLNCLDTTDLVLSENSKFKLVKANEMYDYYICAKLINTDEKIVLLGNIIIHIGDVKIPGDIKHGDFVEFSVSRVDLY